MEGITTRLTTAGLPVLRIHYSADPAKRPGTEAGNRWLRQALQGYPGGLHSPRWRKEYEMEYAAMGGTRLLPEWEAWIAQGHIVIPPFVPMGYRLYGSYDHGWRNPACYLVHGIDASGSICTLWEFYAPRVPVAMIARIILGEAVHVPDGRRFEGNPFATQETWRVADPAMWAEDHPMEDETNKSIADVFRRANVAFVPGVRGGDTLVADWLHSHYWADPLQPRYRITTDCPKLIWELGQQRHRDVSALAAERTAAPEKLVDKDNHAFDALKYFLLRFPPSAIAPKPPMVPNTFTWWQQQAKRANDGEAVRTYRRAVIA